jgi:hypothetical protein
MNPINYFVKRAMGEPHKIFMGFRACGVNTDSNLANVRVQEIIRPFPKMYAVGGKRDTRPRIGARLQLVNYFPEFRMNQRLTPSDHVDLSQIRQHHV